MGHPVFVVILLTPVPKCEGPGAPGSGVPDTGLELTFDNLEGEGLDMDIASPFVVVPVIVVTFLCCILFATRGNPDSHQPTEGSEGHVRPHGS
ncbi:hypothetical protein [Occallatibacter savannae]|uniref:hypothetical protein n=1 Tax=Occallatibacter savannae TaxID=1002691 RepID=UPI0013A546ED|nr:hypothetical protein [Occallatibacter savannae]